MIIRVIVLSAVLGICATTAEAALVTYDLAYSGAFYGNSIVGTGTVTIDTSLLVNPGNTDYPTTPFITALSLTISGAPTGDGTFGLADYGVYFLETNGGTLNLSEQLIGQPTSQDPFGTPFGTGGDFNFISNGNDPDAPTGFSQFTLEIGNDNGQRVLLTSFAPAAASVPEPSAVIPAGIAALAGLGTVLRRKIVGAS